MMETKIMRAVIHQSHQFFAFVDDGSTTSPGKYGRKKTCDLPILSFGKKMGNGNGIIFYKKGLVVSFYFII